MKTGSKIAIAAAAVGAWLCARKTKSVSGIGKVDINDFEELVILCKSIAKRLQTRVKIQQYPQYGWASISFETDPFGGTYVNLHYDYNTGEVINWYGEDYATIINSQKQLERLVEQEYYSMLKGRYGEMYAAAHFDFLERNNRIGNTRQLDYGDYVVSTKDGKHAVEFQWMSDGDVSVSAWYKGDGSNPQFDWEFWNHVGFYKTLSGAKRGAKKFMADRGYELKDVDLNKVK